MAIRQRITPPKTTGYPLPKFMRYVKRFGQPLAAFMSPKMQVIAGKAEPIKGPGEATWEFWSLDYLNQLKDAAAVTGHEEWANKLHDVIAGFPARPEEIARLPSSPFST